MREAKATSVIRGGRVGAEGSRMEGRVKSVLRRRCLAVAARAARGGRPRPGGGARMGVRNEGWGGGRLKERIAWVSCSIVGWDIFEVRALL